MKRKCCKSNNFGSDTHRFSHILDEAQGIHWEKIRQKDEQEIVRLQMKQTMSGLLLAGATAKTGEELSKPRTAPTLQHICSPIDTAISYNFEND